MSFPVMELLKVIFKRYNPKVPGCDTSDFQKLFRPELCDLNDIKFLITQNSQLTFTCLMSTIETLKKGVKYVQS